MIQYLRIKHMILKLYQDGQPNETFLDANNQIRFDWCTFDL